MNTLFLRLPARADGRLALTAMVDGQVLQRHGPADALADLLAPWPGTPLVLITPAGLSIALAITASARQRREAGTDLVALAEDQLGEDYDSLHWTLSPLDDERVLARGIRRQWLSDWLQRLAEAGASPLAAIPEEALLPSDDSHWVLYPSPDSDEVLVHTGPAQSALVSADDLALILDTLAAELPVGAPMRLRHPDGLTLPALPERLVAVSCPWTQWSDLLPQRPTPHWTRHPQNWLHGALAPRRVSAVSPRWRWAAAAVLAVLLLQGGLNRVEAWRLDARAQAAQREAETLYRQYFPSDTRVVNLARQLRERLRGGSGGDALHLLQVLADTAPNPQWQVVRLNYRRNGSTEAEIVGDTLAGSQQWLAALAAAGIPARLEQVRQEGDTTQARLLVEAL